MGSPSPLIDVALILGDAVRLGVLDRRFARSVRTRSKELRGCRAIEGDRGVEVEVEVEDCGNGAVACVKDIERSEVGVESSMARGFVGG